MRNIQLNTLRLENFKGIREFELNTTGADSIAIYGDNATGKTSIADAFIWLLFDKDTQNKKDFGIKTLVDGKEVHNLEHTVEGSFSIDGKPLTLKKVYKEKWTKKRGQQTAEFSGHETDHYVDEVPVKKSEYNAKVGSLIDEDVFKLITSPTYFNEQIKWQDRRKTLLEICGDIDENDVFASQSDLKVLPEILKGKSVDDYKKIVAEKRRKINSELDTIPVRISEVQKSLNDLTGTPESLNEKLAEINGQIEETESIIRNIKNGQAVQDKESEIKKLSNEMDSYKSNFSNITNDLLNRLRVKGQEVSGNVSITNSQLNSKRYERDSVQQLINSLNEDIEQLRKYWNEVDQLQLETHDQTTCPTCKQNLPVEDVKKAHAEALANHNEQKSNRKAVISEKGKNKAAEKLKREGALDTLNREIEALEEKLSGFEKDLDKVRGEIKTTQESAPNIEDDETYKGMQAKHSDLMAQFNDLKESALDSIADIQEELHAQKSEKAEVEHHLAAHKQAEKARERITELEQQQSLLAEQYQELEHHLHLTEEFTRAKVNLLEEKINEKFKYARFKLFNTQINGGLEETCETIFDGVPYGAGLNNAARINVGIDIINTLTEYYGIRAPIFIDNAESVTRLIDSDSQVVSLVVSESDKELRVEVAL